MREKGEIAKNFMQIEDATLARPADFTLPEELFEELLHKILSYHPSTDLTLINKAYETAKEAHKNQFRKSGEPYIIHPLCVAIILAELELDKETIAAGLLHDVAEDTVMSIEEISIVFGEEVALLVDGVTKLVKLSNSIDKTEREAENLRKMFLAMAKDIRVILIKLADRLHNMRTLQYKSKEKQEKIAKETMEIYAPIAFRLGIYKIKAELEDLSLKYLRPEVYYDLIRQLQVTENEREKFKAAIVADVKTHMEKALIRSNVYAHTRHIFTLYRKMVYQQKELDQIFDTFAVRIIVDSIKDCYAALGIMHECYKPVPGTFRDFIAMPKPNMYQSLHTTLIAEGGQPFEVQIRTVSMHRTAEYGIAAHWKYREDEMWDIAKGAEEKLSWLNQILEWQKDMSDNKEFISLLKNDLDLFTENIYCFTPAGDVVNLPEGSTPIDFAYSIHTAVGNKMVGARVNGQIVSFHYIIKNGDRVEILTSQNSEGPSRSWLEIVKTTQAKNKIAQWFKYKSRNENIAKGKELLYQYCKQHDKDYEELIQDTYKDKVLNKFGFQDWGLVLAATGQGAIKEGQIVNKLQEEWDAAHFVSVVAKEENQVGKHGIFVKGIPNANVRFSHCCNPVPGDEIIGYATKRRGITIHRTDCVNILKLSELDRIHLVEAEWEQFDGKENYQAEIIISAQNRIGILADISNILAKRKIDVMAMDIRINKLGIAFIDMSFEIPGKEELTELIKEIRKVENVIEIERTTG